MKKFDIPNEPKEYVEFWLAPYVKDGQLDFRSRNIDADRIIDQLDLKLSQTEPRHFLLDDTKAVQLLEGSRHYKEVAKYGATVAAVNLTYLGPLPGALRVLAAEQLLRLKSKTRRGRKKGDNYERDRWIYWTVRDVAREFNVPIARNEASNDMDPETGDVIIGDPCACDYVADALSQYGGPGFNRVVEIYYEMKDFMHSTRALDPKREIARALVRPRQNPRK